MKKYIHSLIFTILFTVQTLSVCAQPDFEDDVQDTPLDGGIGLLIAAGVIYGFWKRVRNK